MRDFCKNNLLKMRFAIILGFLFGITHGFFISEGHSSNNFEKNQFLITEKSVNMYSPL